MLYGLSRKSASMCTSNPEKHGLRTARISQKERNSELNENHPEHNNRCSRTGRAHALACTLSRPHGKAYAMDCWEPPSPTKFAMARVPSPAREDARAPQHLGRALCPND